MILPVAVTERDKIEYLKKVLLGYCVNDEQIRAVQYMAGHAGVNEYLSAIYDGIHFGNWPWVRMPKGVE